jgi:hypothetical protein
MRIFGEGSRAACLRWARAYRRFRSEQYQFAHVRIRSHANLIARLPQEVQAEAVEQCLRSERWLGRTEFRPKDYMRTLVGDDEFVQPKRNETAPRSEGRLTFKSALTQPRLLEMDV